MDETPHTQRLRLSILAVVVGVSGLLMAALVYWLPAPYGVMVATLVWLVGLFSLQTPAMSTNRKTARLVMWFQVTHAAVWLVALGAALLWPGWRPALWVGGGVMAVAGAAVGHIIFHSTEPDTAVRDRV